LGCIIFTIEMTIERHISGLLYRYDCVIIPGLGGFVANHTPATINHTTNLVFPPSKSIIFNKNLITNDGLLTDTISREENISYNEANSKVAVFSNYCKEKLQRRERIEFAELGVLYFDNENNIQFKPDFSANFLSDSFGLMPVAARELVKAIEEKKQEAKVIELQKETVTNPDLLQDDNKEKKQAEVIEITRKKSAVRKYWPAAAVLLPVVFYSIWIPVKTDVMKTGYIDVADLNPFHVRSEKTYVERNSSFRFSVDEGTDEWKQLSSASNGNAFTIPVDENSYVVNVAESTKVDQNVIPDASMDIHIIGGCFIDPDNAGNLVSTLQQQGYSAYILDKHNGLHRVAISSHADMNEALTAIKDIRAKGNSAVWILEK